MRTYTHGLIGWLLYKKGTIIQQKLAVLGAILPDLILATGYIFHVVQFGPVTQWLHQLLHHSQLHTVTIAMHSFVVIVPLLCLCVLFCKIALPVFIGMLSHAFVDLLTHQKGGYNHLYPLDVPQFVSPFSYTSTTFTVIEHITFIGIIGWLLVTKVKHKK